MGDGLGVGVKGIQSVGVGSCVVDMPQELVRIKIANAKLYNFLLNIFLHISFYNLLIFCFVEYGDKRFNLTVLIV